MTVIMGLGLISMAAARLAKAGESLQWSGHPDFGYAGKST